MLGVMLRRLGPVVALWFLAPLVGEFLLGDFTLADLFLIVPFSLLYGAGAVLIREVGRRTGGWRTMVLLGLAYGVLEEGLVDLTLFNPTYAGEHLLRPAYVPFLGMGAFWTVYVLTLHTVWSTATPILLVEALAGERRRTPWLGRVGLAVVGVLLVVGCVLTYVFTYAEYHFAAAWWQTIGAAVVVVALVVVAVRLRPRPATAEGAVPRPLLVFVATLVAASAFELVCRVLPLEAWLGTALAVAVLVVTGVVVTRWARRRAWTDEHVAAVGVGALLAYAWQSFVTSPIGTSSAALVLVSHLVFAGAALALAGVVHVRAGRDARVTASVG